MKGLENGWVKQNIDDSAYTTKQKINSGAMPMVGVNKYLMDEEEDIEPFRVDYEIERKAIERLKAFRAKRNQAEVDQALEQVEEGLL